MRILIAEDDLDISNLYKKALEKNKHKAVLTSNGSDCLKNYLTNLKNMASDRKHQSNADIAKTNIDSLRNSNAESLLCTGFRFTDLLLIFNNSS